jgi:hypothetical protein
LGNAKEEVVLGGIYSLERIAKNSHKDQSTIMEVLSSFVRKHSPVIIEENSSVPNEKILTNNSISITVQAALTVISRRSHIDEKNTKILSI